MGPSRSPQKAVRKLPARPLVSKKFLGRKTHVVTVSYDRCYRGGVLFTHRASVIAVS